MENIANNKITISSPRRDNRRWEELNIYLNSYGKRSNQTPFHCKDRVRDDYLLLLTLSGEAWVENEDRREVLGKGDWFLLRPNEKYSFCDVTPWSMAWIHFSGKIVDEVLDALGFIGVETLRFRQQNTQAQRHLFKIIETAHVVSLAAEVMQVAKILELFSCLNRNIIWETQNKFPFQILEEYVNANIANQICLEDLAQLANLSTFHFLRKFKYWFEYTPMQYVQKARINHAKNLFMKSPNVSIIEIAPQVGFDDSLYFSKVFKRWTGLSPKKYKEQLKKQAIL